MSILTTTAQADSFVEPKANLLRGPEVVDGARHVDEVPSGNGVSVNSDNLRGVKVKVVIQDVFAALECIQVPALPTSASAYLVEAEKAYQ